MPASARLIERSGELKREILQFSQSAEFLGALEKAKEKRFGDGGAGCYDEIANFLDEFILQNRLPDGRTVVEHFVDRHPELAKDERQMLLGWRDIVVGIFEVQRRDGEALIVENLLNELTYRVRSNEGSGVWEGMRPQSLMIARLVPVEDEWLVSGYIYKYPVSARSALYDIAIKSAPSFREVVFRNPQKLEEGWRAQRRDREQFIAFFGSDEVVLPGSEMTERLRSFQYYQMHEARDADGRSKADRVRAELGTVPVEPDFTLNDHLVAAETVGLVYDEIEGLHFLTNYGRIKRAFADPGLLAHRSYRDAVIGYLREDSILPFVFRRLAQRDPERASQVFRRVLRLRRFSWEQDGEALLRRYKPEHFERPLLPSITPISDKLVRARFADSSAESEPSAPRLPGRNDPCPCGSGKKCKRCCGR